MDPTAHLENGPQKGLHTLVLLARRCWALRDDADGQDRLLQDSRDLRLGRYPGSLSSGSTCNPVKTEVESATIMYVDDIVGVCMLDDLENDLSLTRDTCTNYILSSFTL